MATIAAAVVDVSERKDGSALQVTWTPVTNADTCAIVSFPKHTDKSIHVFGTFNAASVAVNGSNELNPANSNNFVALNDPSSTVIAITVAKAKAVLENMVSIQPAATGGGASQSLTIIMLFHFQNPARQ